MSAAASSTTRTRPSPLTGQKPQKTSPAQKRSKGTDGTLDAFLKDKKDMKDNQNTFELPHSLAEAPAEEQKTRKLDEAAAAGTLMEPDVASETPAVVLRPRVLGQKPREVLYALYALYARLVGPICNPICNPICTHPRLSAYRAAYRDAYTPKEGCI
jgi:hypothetical protein